ncbi:hypothetical protein IRJ41_025973, partial [Triplophysa rosa]
QEVVVPSVTTGISSGKPTVSHQTNDPTGYKRYGGHPICARRHGDHPSYENPCHHEEKGNFFFPGRVQVTFRKGPLGYLLQDPTDQARAIKNNPSLQDKLAPIKEELVRQNALNVVCQRGGDASDQKEDFREYILQFGKYKGKSFQWLLENDVGCTSGLIGGRPAAWFRRSCQEHMEGDLGQQS